MSSVDKPILILGAGGHAAVLLDILSERKCKVLGVVSPDVDSARKMPFKCQYHQCDSIVETYNPEEIYLVNAVGSLPNNNVRLKIHEKFLGLGYKFTSVVSKSAIISPSAILDNGVQIMAGCIIQTGTRIRSGSIVNTGAIVDHDCDIGKNNHIAPGVTISGHVITGSQVHIGTGANIIQNISIGNNVVVGAGATITKSIDSNSKVFGFRSQAIIN